ncbi:MAG: hypothetical protein AB1430_03290 [Pseudomonadota bacterium]
MEVNKKAQQGQAMFEYAVACALVTALLVAPVGGGRSTLDILLEGIQRGYARLLTALAVPV